MGFSAFTFTLIILYFYTQMMIPWKMTVTPTVTAAQEKSIKVVTKRHLTLSQNQKKSGAECCPRCFPETENTPTLPEAQHHKTALQKANLLVFWLLYFLLLWQVTCRLSDNGLIWLLKFLISWQFLNLDRDDFNKFVVCPKCTKLYKYDS